MADDEKPKRVVPFEERTLEEKKRSYERAYLDLLLMEGEFEPGTPMTPRCGAPLDDAGACDKGKGHPPPCGRLAT